MLFPGAARMDNKYRKHRSKRDTGFETENRSSKTLSTLNIITQHDLETDSKSNAVRSNRRDTRK